MSLIVIGGIAAVVLFALTLLIAVMFRVVVPTNMVHIVQSAKATISYGRGKDTGNVYYQWPSALPRIGVTVTTFPESVFAISLSNYEAYDQGRLPFVVDIKAFFRVEDSQVAAQRVASFHELESQLTAVLQGAVRRILATSHLETIMQDRSTLGQQFTDEVDEQLKEWGVCTVKTIEFMDIRDLNGSQVIHDIMAKEKSRIDMESRTAVASNNQKAETKEIEAKRVVDLSRQEAEQQVGIRTAEKEREVGIANEKAKQQTEAEAKTTAERSMEVSRVKATRQAEIDKEVKLVQTEAEALAATRQAEGELAATRHAADGITATGKAVADAETAKLLAPVTAQITLAEKIGEDEGYQRYLITIEQVKAAAEVGKAMAVSLEKADLKVIANAGDVQSGVSSLGSILSSSGGTNIAGMLSALAQTPEGEAVLDAVIKGTGKVAKTLSPDA
jgi:flotillin